MPDTNPWEDQGENPKQTYIDWEDEAWSDVEGAQVEREYVQLEENRVYPAHVTSVSTRALPRNDANAHKPPVLLVTWGLRVQVAGSNGTATTVNRTMRDRWIKGAFTDPSGDRQPADYSEGLTVCAMAMGDEAPRNDDKSICLDPPGGEHDFNWWINAVVGYPLRVRPKNRTYTRRDGSQGTTQDINPSGPWPEGEVLAE